MSTADQPIVNVVPNALSRYSAAVQAVARRLAAARTVQPVVPLEPDWTVADFGEFTNVTDIGLAQVASRTYLLDLMRNPGTRTTKTVASILMVARAVSHIRRTGERLILLTPTSGNKGTALRDAVARAYATGLATPDVLRILTVVPEASLNKLRDGPLSADPALRAANPLALARVERPADVKHLGLAMVEGYADELLAATGFRLWYTLDLDNYRAADAVRAFVEADLLPITENSGPRIHLHAVSSAYGLLGYHVGHQLLADGFAGFPVPTRHPGFFLVQQLSTADMVTSLLGVGLPAYAQDSATGVWRQGDAPEFPAETDDPQETIDSTFYTKAPPTSAAVNEIVARCGGGGVVVSRLECLARYDAIRGIAAHAGVDIPADPSLIREWSLVMALTGLLVARERELVPADTDVVVHASGYYSDEMIKPVRGDHLCRVNGADDLAKLLFTAAGQ